LAVNTRDGTFTRKNCAMPGTQAMGPLSATKVAKNIFQQNAHRQITIKLPMCIDRLNQMRYNALWQY
jgi:hypothetical protein